MLHGVVSKCPLTINLLARHCIPLQPGPKTLAKSASFMGATISRVDFKSSQHDDHSTFSPTRGANASSSEYAAVCIRGSYLAGCGARSGSLRIKSRHLSTNRSTIDCLNFPRGNSFLTDKNVASAQRDCNFVGMLSSK